MSNARISDSLNGLFANHSIVFWYDVEGEFSNAVDSLSLDGVKLIRVDDQSNLRIKMQIEGSPNQRLLLYSNQPEPEPSKDWLLDVRLRSKVFRADSASILLEDLGLTTLSLRSHLKERAKFFKAKDRVDRLKRLISSEDSAGNIDRKMIAVLTRADLPELFSILQRIYGAYVVDGVADLSTQPKPWQDICLSLIHI